jgi:hypothetical protein
MNQKGLKAGQIVNILDRPLEIEPIHMPENLGRMANVAPRNRCDEMRRLLFGWRELMNFRIRSGCAGVRATRAWQG